ncbi:MAG: nucleotide exchange factor GrpE [Clostridia bacterium]
MNNDREDDLNMPKGKKDEKVEKAEKVEAIAEEIAKEEEAPPEPCDVQLQELKDKYMRTMAEYDNFRKRTARERDGIFSDGACSTISEFLATYDNLERAIITPTEDTAYFKGIEMIFAGICDTLTKLGVEIIDPQDGKFDPNLHNAVMHVDDENVGEDVVVEVFQKGFKRGERVIRHATVKVAN